MAPETSGLRTRCDGPLTRTAVGPKLRAAAGVSGPAQDLGSPLEVTKAEAQGQLTRRQDVDSHTST